MIQCKETKEGFQITWDPDDPVESVFNTWTEQDFIDVIMTECNRVIEDHEKNKEQSEN